MDQNVSFWDIEIQITDTVFWNVSSQDLKQKQQLAPT